MRPRGAAADPSSLQVEPLPEFPGGPLELDPPIEPVDGDSLAHLFEPLAQFGDSLGFAVAVEKIPGDAHGYCEPAAKRIAVEAISADFSANAQVKTEVHELAHALVRCERAEEDPELSYAEEEVVVECVAYTVCSTSASTPPASRCPTWRAGERAVRSNATQP